MSEELPDLSDREVVKLLAAQKTLMENQPTPDESHGSVGKVQLKEEYKENIRRMAWTYDVEVSVE